MGAGQRGLQVENTSLELNTEALAKKLGEEDGGEEEGVKYRPAPIA